MCEAAIEAFRLLPTMPAYAPRRGGFAAVTPGQDIGPLEILTFSETVLGRDAPERRALFLWARAKATGGDIGGSISAYCRAAGISASAFRYRRKAACRRIAEALNACLGPPHPAAEVHRPGDEAAPTSHGRTPPLP